MYTYQLVYNGLDFAIDANLSTILTLDASSGVITASAIEEDLAGNYELTWIVSLQDYPSITAQTSFLLTVEIGCN